MSDVALGEEYEDDLDQLDENFEEVPLEAPEPEPVTVEQRARAMGWKPLSEFRGDPRRWTDAATFITHGEEELPILRDQTRRMSEKVARYETEITTLRNTVTEQAAAIKRATGLAQRADEAGYARALAELKAKQREAVETGDTVAFDQVQAQIDASQAARREAEAEFATPPAATPAPAPATEEVWPETREFLAANTWFQSDATLRQAMINAHQAVLALYPDEGRAEQYARARAQVAAAFPAKFPTEQHQDLEEEPLAREPAPAPTRAPARPASRAPVMAPSAPQPLTPRGKSPFEQIPEEERADARAGFDYARKGDPDLPASEYVALYLNPKLNPLELRQRRKKA